ncbi:DUF309 domain-containing protein [Mangrovibacillus cuniculi]|uniref:DUF309 domain-containing protein n=1 Tax=Mangrovibacillus cuniculi TaxID=2593652 RepID=A0A7S8HFH4_9BACI|nr:DUF309 domain-containing protein [Mangrovibacillus cuniculi]QPC46747.1 DUF309 domain-containing protein [Mangrovibacillus cuniculi]
MTNYPTEYIEFLAEFHGSRDYFECHEVLEEYWKEVEPGKKDSVWVSLIQLAVALYHERRHNWNGAKKMINQAYLIATRQEEELKRLSLHSEDFLPFAQMLRERINKEEGYYPVNLPIHDKNLLKAVQEKCLEKNYTWQNTSPVSIDILDRHKLRDRSEVIAARNASLQNKTTR